MAYSKIVASFCQDQSNPFQVEAELKVRKALEKRTGWDFEFTRHEDQYEVDIICYKYVLSGNKFERIFLGRIEVEASKQWTKGCYPSFWKTYSYLRRKVEAWDKNTPAELLDEIDIWTGEPWGDADKTIYLKVAQDLSDCHAVLVLDLWNYNDKKLIADKRSGLTQDRSHYFRTSLAKCKVTRRGWDDVIDLITDRFEIKTNESRKAS